MNKFPYSLVDILRHDITHLDLTSNNLGNFEFLRGFLHLKSLVVDGSKHMEQDSFPPMEKLELFYANKCRIEFPRSFVNRVAIVFPSLRYFSMMYNPILKREYRLHIWKGREHRLRMFAIFMNPNLIHFNDREISDDERDHSRTYHMYLGPIDCTPSKFKTLPDTDDIRKILPVKVRKETEEYASMIAQDEADRLGEALACVSIFDYFSSDSATYRAEKATRQAQRLQVAPAPSECFSE